MFLHSSNLPDNPTFAPTFEDGQREDRAASALWDATRDLQLFRDNANAEDYAIGEAYERRNRAIFEATGVQLPNPRRGFTDQDLQKGARIADAGGDPFAVMDDLEADWQRRAAELAKERPEFAGVIAADRPIIADAQQLARDSETGMARAQQEAAAAKVGTARSLGNTLGGGIAGMLRDPTQVGTLFLGGGISSPARTVFGRLVERVLSEAAVNAGVEAGVQVASQDWKRSAGVEHGLGASLQQVGLAALFGGGFGGLVQGGGELFRLAGKTLPDEAFARLAAGEPQQGDMATIADALGMRLDPETVKAADIAAEQAAMDADAFGPPPAGMMPGEAEKAAADALRQADSPASFLPGDDPQLRAEQVDRIVRSEFPIGPEPKRPVTLMQFLASRDVGGLVDEGGALAAMDLSRKFVPGGGALVRKNGKPLDRARELAAEAGYFDDMYGDPQTAIQRSTPDDLLQALNRERSGEPVLSTRNDGGRVFDWMEYQASRRQQDSYRRIVEEVDHARSTLDLGEINDRLLTRAAELVDDETDAVTALEKALDEDYRFNDEADIDLGEQADAEFEIPFFEGRQDAGAVPPVGGAPAGSREIGGAPGERDALAGNGEQLPGAGGDEGSASQPGLRRTGDTPEPASDQAVADAEAVLAEARGAESEATAAGEQTLIDGVKPVSTKEKLEAQAAKPMRGGDKAMPEGGLFDLDSQKQIDMWDAMPAATTADGAVLHATYDTMVSDADRSQHFSDLISSCKD